MRSLPIRIRERLGWSTSPIQGSGYNLLVSRDAGEGRTSHQKNRVIAAKSWTTMHHAQRPSTSVGNMGVQRLVNEVALNTWRPH